MRPSWLVIVSSLCALISGCARSRGEVAPATTGARTAVRGDSMVGPAGSYTTTRSGPLADSIVYLSTGDSIEWQSFGPATVTGQPTGLLVTYHPFFALRDTVRVQRVALAFFRSLRPKFTRGEPPFVVLRAVNLSAAQRTDGRYRLRAYGVVLEKRTDGRWYQLDDSIPLPP